MNSIELLFIELALTNPNGYVYLTADYIGLIEKVMNNYKTNIVKNTLFTLISSGIITSEEIYNCFDMLALKFNSNLYLENGCEYAYPSLESLIECRLEYSDLMVKSIHLLALLINGEIRKLEKTPLILAGYTIAKYQQKKTVFKQ